MGKRRRFVEISPELKAELRWALEQVENSFGNSLDGSAILAEGSPHDPEREEQDRVDQHWLDWVGAILERLDKNVPLIERELHTCVKLIKMDDMYDEPWYKDSGPSWLLEQHQKRQVRARSVVASCEAAIENARRLEEARQ